MGFSSAFKWLKGLKREGKISEMIGTPVVAAHKNRH